MATLQFSEDGSRIEKVFVGNVDITKHVLIEPSPVVYRTSDDQYGIYAVRLSLALGERPAVSVSADGIAPEVDALRVARVDA